MTKEDFQNFAPSIPHAPGIYQYIDKAGQVLYVGKAKSLKNRLTSYFSNMDGNANKIKIMLSKADHIEYTVMDSEYDALLIEATFIKKFQPPYNAMLKDGKSYTYICIKNEPFPRVFFTRRLIRDGSTYFGPFVSKFKIEQILEIVKKLFPLRTCSLNLSADNIAKGKFKVCLEYHIKNCMGPCEGFESAEAYQQKIDQVKNIISGNFRAVKQHLLQQMMDYSDRLEFEQAELIKNKLSLFEDYQAKSTVVSASIKDVDVFSLAVDEEVAYINYLKVVNGSIINTYVQEVDVNLDDDPALLLSLSIESLREKFNSLAPEILVNVKGVALEDKNIKVWIPKIGDKLKLLELAEKNTKYYIIQKKKERISAPKVSPTQRVLETLQNDLNMPRLPKHIECFDNSNIQGSYPVSSCVVFYDAKPAKSEYRRFIVKTVDGPNDFASMKEVVHRRYSRLLDEQKALPDLVVIDGGKGQLSAAVEVLQNLGILNQLTVIGIAKRLEEIYFPGDPVPLHINKKSESLKVIQQIRNEAHRFAITFHRDRRSQDFTVSELANIQGVGKKSSDKLLTHFKSTKRIAESSLEDLVHVVGSKIGGIVFTYFHASDE